MVVQVLQPQRVRVLDQQPEDAVASRQLPDRRLLLVGEAVGDEVDELPAALADHADGAVLRSGDLAGRDDDPVEHAVQVEVGADRHDRVEQGVDVLG